MTVKQKLQDILISKGMSESQSLEVVELAIPEINQLAGDYKITFDAPYTDYSEAIYNTLFRIVRPIALKWINENKPEAWFKPMFQ